MQECIAGKHSLPTQALDLGISTINHSHIWLMSWSLSLCLELSQFKDITRSMIETANWVWAWCNLAINERPNYWSLPLTNLWYLPFRQQFQQLVVLIFKDINWMGKIFWPCTLQMYILCHYRIVSFTDVILSDRTNFYHYCQSGH